MKGSEERSGSSIARIVETDRMRLAEMLKSEGASRSVLTS
jgi:hypothetical protein